MGRHSCVLAVTVLVLRNQRGPPDCSDAVMSFKGTSACVQTLYFIKEDKSRSERVGYLAIERSDIGDILKLMKLGFDPNFLSKEQLRSPGFVCVYTDATPFTPM